MNHGQLIGSQMKSEEQLSILQEEATKFLNRGDIDELYIVRSQMNEILEKEERKPLDFHSDRYNVIAYTVCLDLYDLPRALKYANKVKNPPESVTRRIKLISEDLNYIERMSKVISYYLTIARKGTEEQLHENAFNVFRISNNVVSNSCGSSLVKIQLLKANAILQYRLGANDYAISIFEEARRLYPSDTEILYYLIKALKKNGDCSRANELIQYVNRLQLKDDVRKLFTNL